MDLGVNHHQHEIVDLVVAEKARPRLIGRAPSLGDPSRWRVVPPGTAPDGPIGIKVLDGGRYAMAKVWVRGDPYAEPWDALVGDWLPGSG